MALIGPEKSHIDVTAPGQAEAVRYYLKDAAARAAIAPTEASTTASMAHPAGSCFFLGGVLYEATADIASGAAIVTSGTGANCRTAVLGADISAIKADVEELKNSSGAVPNKYYGADKPETNTNYGIVYSRTGEEVYITGTATAKIRIRISGDAISSPNKTTADGWPKIVPLASGHRYRIGSEIVSGSCEATGTYLCIANESNTVLAFCSIGDYAEIDGTGDDTMIYIVIAANDAFDALTVRATLTDITNECATKRYVDGLKDETDAAMQAMQDEIDELSGEPIVGTKTLTKKRIYKKSDIAIGSPMPGLSAGDNGYNDNNTPLDISFCAGGGTLEMSLDTLSVGATTCYAITDENSIVLMYGVTSTDFVLTDGVYKCTKVITSDNAKYLYFSAYNSSSVLNYTLIKSSEKYATKDYVDGLIADAGIRYVSPSGSDDNDGKTSATSMATIKKAIDSGGQMILLAGGKYFQNIDMTNAKNHLFIAAAPTTTRPVLYAPNSLISETEEAVEGYSKVYSCPCTYSFNSKNVWIFQDGVPDSTTLISATDRHPLQRGKPYRCEDTKIAKCSAATLDAALTEIENADVYKWFLDTTNHVLYFSRPQAVTAETPIMRSPQTSNGEGVTLFSNVPRGIKLEMTGIGVKYQRVGLVYFFAPVLTDCFCGNVYGQAAFQYNSTTGAKFYRCEAFRVFYQSTGDGFNAHSVMTGDTFAKQTTCFLIDCWAHDIRDDGYSDHGRCETTVLGGLYENNGAGVTPAQGSHCTCYNVFARYNPEANFFYTGNPETGEDGVGGQIACYYCTAKGTGNDINGGTGYRLNGSTVRGLFVGCVAIDEYVGFDTEGSATGELINCGTLNCGTVKSIRMTAYNTTPVT